MTHVKYLIIAVILLIPCVSFADTHTAASCKRNDVNTVLQDATFVTGDVLQIPPCEGTDGTWGTAYITVPSGKKITIQGAGTTATVITHSAIAVRLGTTGSRVTNMGFVQAVAGAYSITAAGSGWRIDHNKFTNSTGATIETIWAVNASSSGVNTISGLIDNNEFIEGRVLCGGILNFVEASEEWTIAVADILGAADKAVFIEDNVFTKTVPDHGNVVDLENSCSYVFRYNEVSGKAQAMVHPLVSYQDRGTRIWELYGNSFTAQSNIYSSTMSIRSGTGVVFGNKNNAAYNYGTGLGIRFDDARIYGGCAGTNTTCAPWGLCDGDSLADGNTDPNPASGVKDGWPCRDQIGRGSEATHWTDSTAAAPAQESMPAYVWANRIGYDGNLWAVERINGSTNYIVPNRDYYLQGSSFDGTSGVGCGTLAARPETCTAGVAYWATTQSCSDLTGMVGVNPATPISGTLYKCASTDTWAEYYTPYTYPHPLRGESEDAVAPTCTFAVDATGLIATGTCSESVDAVTKTGLSFTGSVTGAITATYKDGMPGTNPRFDLGSEVQQSDVVTATYATPGTGIKDAAGNALANFTGASVFNGSTQNTPPTYSVTINKTGTGCTITSSPSGANCGATCSVTVDNGTVVTLGGYLENGWASITYGGDCAANGTVTVNAAKTCTVTCTPIYLLN